MPSRAAADAFLAAWRRSLETSWSLDESLERSTTNGRHLTFSLHRAQRPPDRISVGLGSVNGRRGDQLVTCAPGSGGRVHCATTGLPPPYASDVATQMSALQPYVSGPQALYVVAQVAGCFQLTLRLPGYPIPPYGGSAVFCFDPSSGAPAGSVVVRNEGTDRTRVVAVHSPATDGDLSVPDLKDLQQAVPSP